LTLAVVTALGVLATPAPGSVPKVAGTVNAEYTLQISGVRGTRTAHAVIPVNASFLHAMMSPGLWVVSLLGPNFSMGPRCAAATYCADGEPAIVAPPSADITFLDLRAVTVLQSATRRKWILSGSMRTTGRGLIGAVDFERWRCQGGGMPTTSVCLLESYGSQIPTPTPIVAKAGEQVRFSVDVAVTKT
jgi:hypothetical protein